MNASASHQLPLLDNRGGHSRALTLQFARYQDGTLALRMLANFTDEADCVYPGMPWGAANRNVPSRDPLPDDLVAVPGYGEHQGLADMLAESGIVEPTPVEKLISGHVEIPVYRLTAKAQAQIPPPIPRPAAPRATARL
jgi:hypothetical protein